MLAVHSQHIHAEVTGWRTPKGLLLREPVKASFTYTPALAKSALLPSIYFEQKGYVPVWKEQLHNSHAHMMRQRCGAMLP